MIQRIQMILDNNNTLCSGLTRKHYFDKNELEINIIFVSFYD